MTLRRRTIIIIVIMLIMLVGMLYGMQRAFVLHSFARLEQMEAKEQVQRALYAIEGEGHHLETLAADWANWDDTYQFVQDGNQAYRQSNLVDAAFVSARLNLLVIADLAGRAVFAKGFDLEAGREMAIPEFAPEALPQHPLLRSVRAAVSTVGLVLTSRGPMLVAALPIRTSSGEGPVRGTLIMGRLLDEALLSELAEQTRLPLRLWRLDEAALPAEVSEARAALSAQTPIWVRPLNADEVAGYTLLDDVDGNPALLLRVVLPRDVYRYGNTSFMYLVGATLSITLLFCGVLLFAIERWVLRRVEVLGQQVNRVGESRDFSARVVLNGKDELSALAHRVNVMLAELQKTQESICQREVYLEGLARASQALLTPASDIPYAPFLEALGRAAGASRVYVFLNHRAPDGQLLTSQVAEWCAEGVTPQIDNPELQNFPLLENGFGRWVELLSRGEAIKGLIKDFPDAERPVLEAQDIQAILVLPLIVEGSFVGFIGFDQCAAAREWEAAQEDLLRVAAADLSQALKHRQAEKVQNATYRISEAAHAVQNLHELFQSIHTIVGELMPARNFYIALYDEAGGMLHFPYFVDEYDSPPAPKRPGRGLTEYVLRSGQPLLATPEVFQRLLDRGEVESIGAPSIDWLGVPLKVQGKAIGVLAVQTYSAGIRYGEREKSILAFVSEQVAMAIERKRAEEALRQSESEYRTIFETTGTAMIIVEEDTTISLANREFEQLSGYRKEEVEGKLSWTQFAVPEDVERMKEYHRLRRISPDAAPRSYETGFIDRHGQRKQVLLAVDMIPGTRRSVVAILDISERKRAEEERVELEAQLRQAQKMEAVGLLAGGVAHEFNNLLTVVLGNAELGLAELQPNQPLHKELSAIQRAARRSALLTQQLLAFSRRQVLEMVPLEINALVNEFASMLTRLIEADIVLQLNLSPDAGQVRGDANALEQMLMNLAVNARDAMPQGGTLRIATALVTPDNDYLLSHPGVKAGSYVRVTVADTGVGMDEELQKHLFEPFFTTKEVGKGTGLGLSVVYGIVTQHGGWIDVHSRVGEGTRFEVYLPGVEG